jgi:hypothetical protein
VSGRSLILILLKPALLSRGGLASSGLTLNLDLLGLVGAQLIGEVGFFGRLGGSRSAELLDVGISVAGLDGRRLVGTKLAKVEFLDRVGAADSGGQEGAASDRGGLLPGDTGKEGGRSPERLRHHLGWIVDERTRG